MGVEVIEYKGKEILFADFSDIKDQSKMNAILQEMYKNVGASNGDILFLSDITKATIGPDFVAESKRLGLLHKDKISKTAVLGISGLKGLLLKGYNVVVKSDNPSEPFDTKEEAFQYLVS